MEEACTEKDADTKKEVDELLDTKKDADIETVMDKLVDTQQGVCHEGG